MTSLLYKQLKQYTHNPYAYDPCTCGYIFYSQSSDLITAQRIRETVPLFAEQIRHHVITVTRSKQICH